MIKHWTFNDSNLANNFGSHVRGQLPWYDLATGLVRCIAENYLPENGLLYDLGASDGNITRTCGDIIKERNVSSFSIESSKEMCSVWNGTGNLVNQSVLDYDFQEFDLCICFLTLMFIEPKSRFNLFNNLINKINDGGALVIVDKFNGKGGYNDVVSKRMTLRQKLASGESHIDIINKELSLSGVQRPLDQRYERGDQFFQVGEFKGFILSK